MNAMQNALNDVKAELRDAIDKKADAVSLDSKVNELTEDTDTAETIAITATTIGGGALISNIVLIVIVLFKRKRLF